MLSWAAALPEQAAMPASSTPRLPTFGIQIAIGMAVGLSQPLWHWRASIVRERLWTEVLWSTVLAALCIPLLPLDMISGSITAGLFCGLATGGMLFAL